ncbi:MAG: alpha-amylase family glycosyl hydrolase [Burkholderiales bacterium]
MSFNRRMFSVLILSVVLGACSASSIKQAELSPALPRPDVSKIPFADRGSKLSANWRNGAFMEIFVRGFKDSNDDGIGDLRGLTQRLDYLKDLGIKGIWLMPINTSQDKDHGYSVSDYRNIDPDYGTLADFDELLREAHARDIGVVMDYVINHSAANNAIFLNAASSTDNAYRDWYIWRDQTPTDWDVWGKNPWKALATGSYYAPFTDIMPDWNLRNPAVVDYHISNMRFWLNRGVDGFRFDAVGMLFENGPKAFENQAENYLFMGKLRQEVEKYSQRFVVCEGPDWGHIEYARADSCGRTFAFKHHSAIVQAAQGDEAAVGRVADYFKTTQLKMATMLTNHDSFAGDRPWNQFKGNEAQYRLAAATYLLMPGTPFVYYGEEIGMAGISTLEGDASLRGPLSWTADANNAGFSSATSYRPVAPNVMTQNIAAQLANPNSLRAFYKTMIGLRNAHPSLAVGSYENAFSQGGVMGFQRSVANERTLVLINYGTREASISVPSLQPYAALTSLYPANAAQIKLPGSGELKPMLKPQSVQVFRING